MKKYLKIGLLLGGIFFPILSLAQTAVTDYAELANRILDIAQPMTLYLANFALFFTAYEAFRYMKAGADAQKREEARNGMVYGIIAIFIMLSVWGFVWLLANSFFSGSADWELDSTVIPQLSE